MTRPLLASLFALACAAPALAAEVNVYSYRQPELIQPLVEAFTAESGIAVNVVFLDKGLVERLQAEGARSPADVVLTVDISRLNELVQADVVQPVTSDTIASNIPPEFRDPDGRWFGLTSRARIVYAAKDRVKEGEVTTYEDLADPRWKGRICTRPGTHDYTLGLLSAYIVHHGEAKAAEWLAGLRANLARKPQGNDRAQVKAIWAGECDISLGNTYYMAAMQKVPEEKVWTEAVRMVFPTFEGAGTHMNISGMAMTKAAPNRDAALKFMEFLSSAKAQAIYAEANAEFPLLPGTPVSAEVAGWGSFAPDTISLMDVAKARPAALKLVEASGFDN